MFQLIENKAIPGQSYALHVTLLYSMRTYRYTIPVLKNNNKLSLINV